MSKFSIRAIIEEMEVGRKEFSASEVSVSTIAQYSSRLGKKLGREYHYHTIAGGNTIVLIREA